VEGLLGLVRIEDGVMTVQAYIVPVCRVRSRDRQETMGPRNANPPTPFPPCSINCPCDRRTPTCLLPRLHRRSGSSRPRGRRRTIRLGTSHGRRMKHRGVEATDGLRTSGAIRGVRRGSSRASRELHAWDVMYHCRTTRRVRGRAGSERQGDRCERTRGMLSDVRARRAASEMATARRVQGPAAATRARTCMIWAEMRTEWPQARTGDE
jgi:hypothetical protein